MKLKKKTQNETTVYVVLSSELTKYGELVINRRKYSYAIRTDGW